MGTPYGTFSLRILVPKNDRLSVRLGSGRAPSECSVDLGAHHLARKHFMSWWKNLFAPTPAEDDLHRSNAQGKGTFHPGLALRRLMSVPAIGSLLIVVYALRYTRIDFLDIFSVISVGLMADGAPRPTDRIRAWSKSLIG